jgi:hypothetical protein
MPSGVTGRAGGEKFSGRAALVTADFAGGTGAAAGAAADGARSSSCRSSPRSRPANFVLTEIAMIFLGWVPSVNLTDASFQQQPRHVPKRQELHLKPSPRCPTVGLAGGGFVPFKAQNPFFAGNAACLNAEGKTN